MSCSPWAAVQVTVPSPIWAEPSQTHVRSSRPGSSSSAAARVTVLKMEPGGKVEERKRLR